MLMPCNFSIILIWKDAPSNPVGLVVLYLRSIEPEAGANGRDGTSNHNPHILWDLITCSCP